MVSVSDIKIRNAAEGVDYHIVGGNRYAPDRVRDTVHCREIKQRFAGCVFSNQIIDGVIAAIGEKDRAGLCVQTQDVTRTVVFFVLCCTFVFENDVVILFVYRTARDQAGLRMVAHLQPIKIKARLVFERQGRLLNQTVKIRRGLGIHRVAVNVGARR